MNPYAPSEIDPNESEADEENAIRREALPRLWPLMPLNLAFVLSAILVVVLPGLSTWLLVSVLIVCSIGGWTLALSLRQQ